MSSPEKFCILIKISLKFVPKGPIDYNPALVDNDLVLNRQQAIISTNAHPIHWCTYPVPGGEELMKIFLTDILTAPGHFMNQ